MQKIAAAMIMPATTIVATLWFIMKRSYKVIKSCGIEERILNKRTKEIPFPTPLSVILSPIHIRSADPAVIATTQMTIPTILRRTLPSAYPIKSPEPPKPTAMAVDSKRARPMVTNLVYSVNFLLPSSPSFCISSKAGIATVKSWIIMDEVI